MNSFSWEQNMLDEYGWYMDAIYAEEYDGIHANYHTHGVQENFQHSDLQIVLDIDPTVANDIFVNLIQLIKNGIKFEQDKEYSGIISDFKLVFKQYTEMERNILRVILPDENGILPTEKHCNEYYKAQLDEYTFD